MTSSQGNGVRHGSVSGFVQVRLPVDMKALPKQLELRFVGGVVSKLEDTSKEVTIIFQCFNFKY